VHCKVYGRSTFLKLAPDFQFNQGNLQDFVDCQRRFWLRYIRKLAWPAIPSEPVLENERQIQLGALFHRLAYQYWLGVPADRLRAMAEKAQMDEWWQNFTTISKLKDLPGITLHPEFFLSAKLQSASLVGKYDLLAMQPDGQAIIFDWKTSPKRPPSSWLNRRVQTRLYPYLLVQAGGYLSQAGSLLPEKVSMRYWFAAFPDQPEWFAYNQAQFQADRAYLSGLIETICAIDDEDFYQTNDEKKCAYCVYRSLCDRGIKAGQLADLEDTDQSGDEFGFSIDIDQISEISF
jgi:hypothetical protein